MSTSRQLDDADALFRRAMDPYRAKRCIYLRRAHVERRADTLVGVGGFAIDESCYIDDTGHFNAAEFVICFNQLMYVTLAATIEGGLAPELAAWGLDDFWERQLPDLLIHKFASSYSRPIDARDFHGEIHLASFGTRALARGMLTLDATVRFWDDTGGKAQGSAGLAFINVPESARLR